MLLLNLFDRFLANRKIIGLSFVLFGGPIIYFMRDGLGLAPGSSAFTAVFTVLPILLITPLSNFDRLFAPNKNMYYLCFFYLGIAVLYLFAYVGHPEYTNVVYEMVNFTLIFLLFLFLLTISEASFEEKFLKATLIIAGLGSFLLVLYSVKNGYSFGSRASISFATGTRKEDAAAGNPHIYARAAYALFFCGLMLMKSKGLWRLLGMGGAVLGFVVIAMTQTFAAILSLLIAGIIYLLAKYSVKRVLLSIFNFFFGLKGLISMLTIGAVGFYLVNYTSLSRFYNLLTNVILKRTTGMINLLLKNPDLLKKAAALSKTPVVDASASTRVETISKMFKNFSISLDNNPLPVFFGYGYQTDWVDSPVMQAWLDMGIIPFLLYLSIVVITLRLAFKTIKYNASPARQFVAYFIILISVHSFTFGMPYGTYLWFYFALSARFLKPISPRSQLLNHTANA